MGFSLFDKNVVPSKNTASGLPLTTADGGRAVRSGASPFSQFSCRRPCNRVRWPKYRTPARCPVRAGGFGTHGPGEARRGQGHCRGGGVAGLGAEDLDYVGFYDKPLMKFERLLETYLAIAPAGYRSFRQAVPVWLKEKLHIPSVIRRALDDRYRGRCVFTDHHEAHAASAFLPSPFDEAAVITFDGVGEWSTTCIGTGRGNRVELSHEIRFPHSLGLLYAAFTYYTGFRINWGEYKVMGLAPYGQPVYKDLILRNLLDLKEDGSYRREMSYFNYCQGLSMTSAKFHRLFGGPPRKPAPTRSCSARPGMSTVRPG